MRFEESRERGVCGDKIEIRFVGTRYRSDAIAELRYGVALVSRIDKIIGLLCKRDI